MDRRRPPESSRRTHPHQSVPSPLQVGKQRPGVSQAPLGPGRRARGPGPRSAAVGDPDRRRPAHTPLASPTARGRGPGNCDDRAGRSGHPSPIRRNGFRARPRRRRAIPPPARRRARCRPRPPASAAGRRSRCRVRERATGLRPPPGPAATPARATPMSRIRVRGVPGRAPWTHR